MFKPLEIVGDTAFRTTDQKVRGSNPFERARHKTLNQVTITSIPRSLSSAT